MSKFFSLSWVQFIESVISAVVVAVLVYLDGVIQPLVANGMFNLFTFHWSSIASYAFVTLIGVLATKLGTTSQGNFLGAVKVN